MMYAQHIRHMLIFRGWGHPCQPDWCKGRCHAQGCHANLQIAVQYEFLLCHCINCSFIQSCIVPGWSGNVAPYVLEPLDWQLNSRSLLEPSVYIRHCKFYMFVRVAMLHEYKYYLISMHTLLCCSIWTGAHCLSNLTAASDVLCYNVVQYYYTFCI